MLCVEKANMSLTVTSLSTLYVVLMCLAIIKFYKKLKKQYFRKIITKGTRGALRTTISIPLPLSSAAFGINSILFQRGIYPPETFSIISHYDMSLQFTTDPKLKNYLTNVVSQLKGDLTRLISVAFTEGTELKSHVRVKQ